jgi:hypothetical protein
MAILSLISKVENVLKSHQGSSVANYTSQLFFEFLVDYCSRNGFKELVPTIVHGAFINQQMLLSNIDQRIGLGFVYIPIWEKLLKFIMQETNSMRLLINHLMYMSRIAKIDISQYLDDIKQFHHHILEKVEWKNQYQQECATLLWQLEKPNNLTAYDLMLSNVFRFDFSWFG